MAMAEQQSSGEPKPEFCENAREYVLKRLDSENPLTPTELADEYECTANHMRKTLASLKGDGEVQKTSRGHYVLQEEDSQENPGEEMGFPADEDAGMEEESMPTQAEYDRQHRNSEQDFEEIEIGTDADEEPEADEDTGVDELEEAPAPVLPMEPKKLGMVLAAALVLWLIYDNLYGGVDTDVETSDLDEEQDGGDEDGGLTGGLAG